jgi:hypothetical protein
MNTSEVIGLAAAIVALAGLSVAIIYGDKTASVIKAAGDSFSGAIRAATLQPGSGRTLAR